MAQRLRAPVAETGITTGKFVLVRLSDGAYWSTAGTPAFESYSAGNIANYGIAATEIGSTGEYDAANPAESTPCYLRFVKAAGASLAVSDLVNGLYYEGHAGPELAPPTAAETAVAVWAVVLVSTRTAGWLLRKVAAILLGRTSGGNTTSEKFADVDETDPAANPSVTSVADTSGNRSNVTYSA